MNDNNRRTKWNSLLRIGGLVAALGGMYISAQFSVDGFNFSVDNRSWIGWAIAGIIIVLESVWQKFGDNRTLFGIALVCYGYGVSTNVLGILENRGGYDGNPTSLIVPILFGILLEVFPEPLLAWSISGDTSSDPLGKFIDGLVEEKKSQAQQPSNKHIQYKPQPSFQQAPKSQYKPKFKPAHMQPSKQRPEDFLREQLG
jgi:hypothetical protein